MDDEHLLLKSQLYVPAEHVWGFALIDRCLPLFPLYVLSFSMRIRFGIPTARRFYWSFANTRSRVFHDYLCSLCEKTLTKVCLLGFFGLRRCTWTACAPVSFPWHQNIHLVRKQRYTSATITGFFSPAYYSWRSTRYCTIRLDTREPIAAEIIASVCVFAASSQSKDVLVVPAPKGHIQGNKRTTYPYFPSRISNCPLTHGSTGTPATDNTHTLESLSVCTGGVLFLSYYRFCFLAGLVRGFCLSDLEDKCRDHRCHPVSRPIRAFILSLIRFSILTSWKFDLKAYLSVGSRRTATNLAPGRTIFIRYGASGENMYRGLESTITLSKRIVPDFRWKYGYPLRWKFGMVNSRER